MPKEFYALEVSNLTVAYHGTPVLHNVNTRIPTGVLLAVVGPNGAGKSTFLKALVDLIPSHAGNIALLGGSYSEQQKRVAYVPQRMAVDWDFPTTVFDVALMGRYGHLGWFKRPGKIDKDKAWEALVHVGMATYADTPIGQLSGGQQQRVFLARALTQEAELYLLDEPFVGVDIETEKTMVRLFKQLRTAGKTIVVVHHDTNVLQDYFDWALLLNRVVVACGPVQQVITQEHIAITYCREKTYVR